MSPILLLEHLAFLGSFIIALLLFADLGKHSALGIVASIFLLLLGIWSISEIIYYQIGTDTNTTTTKNTTGETILDNATTNISQLTNITTEEQERRIFAPVEWNFTVMRVREFIGIMFAFLGLYGLFTYTLPIVARARAKK